MMPTVFNFEVDLPDGLWKAIEESADQTGITVTEWLVDALRRACEGNDNAEHTETPPGE
jgi:hypothetical protein